MVPHWYPTLLGGRGGGLLRRAMWPCGGQCCMVAILVIRASWGGSRLWPVIGQGIPGLPECRTRAVRRAAKISLTRVLCAVLLPTPCGRQLTRVPPPMLGCGGL